MDLVRPTTTTEDQLLIRMVKDYIDMWSRQSHILAPLTAAASFPKGRKIILNYALEIPLRN